MQVTNEMLRQAMAIQLDDMEKRMGNLLHTGGVSNKVLWGNGFSVSLDPSIPPDEIRLVSKGVVVSKIVNIGGKDNG
jgi:hypothetical protein